MKIRKQNTTNSRYYNLRHKRQIYNYCYICQRRAGNWYADCSPAKRYGRHGSGKLISGTAYRSYRTWKHTRKKQYKQ